MSKTIGMLLDGFYPSDIRVQKEAGALIEAGYKVTLLCKRRKEEAYHEVVDGIELMRIDAGTSHTTKGIIDIVVSLNFIHPVFKRNLSKFIKKYSIDVLHVHDLPLVKTAVKVAKNHHLQVVADFHENWPEALKVWFQWKKNPLIRLKNKIFFGYRKWSAYEKWAVHHANFVIAVVEEMKIRLIEEHQISDDKIVVITNSEGKGFVEGKLDESIYSVDKNKFIIAYTGGVGPHRGVDTAIEAMSYLEEYDDIVLYITGTSSKAAQKTMFRAIDKFSLQGKVKVLGYRPFVEFYSFMKMASVNLIPHHSNGHTDNTVPHKLFQCMMVGKPLLVSSSTPLKRIVDETGSGLVFEASNARDLADKILELYKDGNKRAVLGENGLASSIEGNYNWEETSKALVEFYEKVT
jgi:glycosyltransferase involved in cell wall biosynthesis